MPFIRDTLKEHEMLFITLTETWLRNHLDAELSIEGYTLLRTDRSRPKKRRGRDSGGVGVYIKNSLAPSTKKLLEFSNSVMEIMAVFIAEINIVLVSVYRSPHNPGGGYDSTSRELAQGISKIAEILDALPTPTPDIIVNGDFNLPKTNWPDCVPKAGAPNIEKDMIYAMSGFASRFFLSQVVLEPTHRAGNILDLIFTNNSALFVDIESIPTYPNSSHHLVKATTFLACGSNYQTDLTSFTNTFDQFNLFSEDTKWSEISMEIESQDWDSLFHGLNVDEMLEVMITKCKDSISHNAPLRGRRAMSKSIPPRHRRVLMRKRTKLRKNLKETTHPIRRHSILAKLTEIELKMQESYKAQRENEENRAVSAIKTNSKYFYSYARKHQKTTIPVGPLNDSSGNLVSDPGGMAKVLAEQYNRAFSDPRAVPTRQNMNDQLPSESIEDIEFSEAHIINAINELGNKSAAGPDRFPAILLKNCKEALAKPLYLIRRTSLDSGQIRTILKQSVIIPIYKDGDRKVPKNYRPVALTSHIIKTFEKVLRNALVSFIEENNLLNPNQHGFRTGRSFLTQLVQHYDRIIAHMEEGKNVDVVYLDFSKAFDKLDFTVTLSKIHNMGIHGKLQEWIYCFLSGRKQTVSVCGRLSEPQPVISGVPQGSVLGPLLFLILLGDIDQEVNHCTVSSFADDTRILGPVSNQEDMENIQADLNSVYNWSKNNNMTFNDDKFECLRYGKQPNRSNNDVYMANNNMPIEIKPSVRDLGVLMSSTATFADHISAKVLSANKKVAWILRTFQTRDPELMLTLWKSLVLPVLDYCCQLWAPCSAGQIQQVENVQKEYLNKIRGMTRLNYWEQLSTLKLYSLQRRRERYVIIYVWKILENLVPNFGIQSRTNPRTGRFCVVPHVRLTAAARVQTIRFASLSVNGPRLFNAMPQSIRNTSECSIESFKAVLDKYIVSVPDEPRVRALIPYCSKSSNSLLHMRPAN